MATKTKPRFIVPLLKTTLPPQPFRSSLLPSGDNFELVGSLSDLARELSDSAKLEDQEITLGPNAKPLFPAA